MITKLGDDTPFTPCPDYIIQVYGLLTAAVWGKIWRYCHMDNRACSASQERMARELGITRRSFNQHARILVEAGYLSVFSGKGKTNTYRDTGLLMQRYAVTGGVNESHTSQIETIETWEPVNEIHTDANESHTGCDDNSHGVCTIFTGDVNENHTNKVFNIEPNKEYKESREETFSPTKQKQTKNIREPEPEPAVVEVKIPNTLQDVYIKYFWEPLTETITEQLNNLVETLSFTAIEKAMRFISSRHMSFEYVPNQAKFYYSQELETADKNL